VTAVAVGLDELCHRLLLLLRGQALRLGRMVAEVKEGGGELPFGDGRTGGDLTVSVPVAVALGGGDRERLREGARLQYGRPGLRSREPGQLGEITLPCFVDGLRIVAPTLVLVFDENLIDSEIAVELHCLLRNALETVGGGK